MRSKKNLTSMMLAHIEQQKYINEMNQRIDSPGYFTGHTERSCDVFGCGRVLTPQERLFGNKCIYHSKNQ